MQARAILCLSISSMNVSFPKDKEKGNKKRMSKEEERKKSRFQL